MWGSITRSLLRMKRHKERKVKFMTDLESFVKILLETKYDIGTIVTLSKVKMGDTNKSFIALANKDDVLTNWYVRQYNLSEEKQDILYEHAFESYLAEKVCGEVQTILPIKTKYGTTWLHETFEGQTHYYAVFNVIKGNEPYSWEFNNLSKNAFNGCAEITAKFHAWGYGFKPPVESGRHEPSLEDQFDRWRVDFPKALKEKKQMPIFRRFTEYLEREMPYLIETTIFCSKELKKHSKSLKNASTIRI